MKHPDYWLEGPIAGVAPLLQPAAHALLQAGADVERALEGFDPAKLWLRPGGAASVGFHLKHLSGATDRLLTYGRGEPLSEAQQAWLAAEKEATGESPSELVRRFRSVVTSGVDQLARTAESSLTTPRAIGRAGLPATVGGCLFHAAEHAARHTGQVITTVKVVSALPGSD